MSRISFSPYGQTTPYIGESKSSQGRKPASSRNATVSFRDSAGDLAITFTLVGALGGVKGNAYKLMFNRISPSGPRWGIRIYDDACNIYLTTTLTLATAMSGLPAAIAGGGLASVLEATVSKSVNETFTDATCADSVWFRGAI